MVAATVEAVMEAVVMVVAGVTTVAVVTTAVMDMVTAMEVEGEVAAAVDGGGAVAPPW